MGSTLCCVLIYGDKYVWGNIGDSRMYKFDGSKFLRITKDHTRIEDNIKVEGEKDTDEMDLNFGHFLTRTINGGRDEPDLYPLTSPYEIMSEGEGFLLCSDGLILNKNENESHRFLKCLQETESLESFTDKLITESYEMGSEDNITCIAAFNR
jgi:protein phosphatase